MKLRRVDATIDRQIITGMVVSTKFLKAIEPIYKPELLMTPFAVTVAYWCQEYVKLYDKAPGKDIQNIFYAKQREGLEDTQAEQIEQFLTSLSDEYQHAEKFNVNYLLDTAEKLFRQRSLKFLSEDIDAHLSQGQLEDAENCLTDYKKLERPTSMGINPLNDAEAYQKAFESREDPLFKLPGVYGEMLTPHLIRGGFIAFLGRAKIGKTWRLMDLGMWAIRDKCNVAFFQMGDLTQDDYMIRQGVHLAKKSNDARYCGELHIPVLDCEHNQRATCPCGGGSKEGLYTEQGEIDKESLTFGRHKVCVDPACIKNRQFEGAVFWGKRKKVEPLTWREAYQATNKWKKSRYIKGFKLASYSNSSVTVKNLEHQLDLWEQHNNFIPDVIIIDYADIMAPEDARKEKREQEDMRWRALRRLSQERRVLVITVTQSNRSGFDNNNDISPTNVGEDKRKMDHVTAFFGLNQNEQEEEKGIIRISNLLSREGKRDVTRQVAVMQCLEIGQPYIASYWQRKKK